MTKRMIVLSLLAVAIVAPGCKGGVSEKDLVGDWTGKITMTDADREAARAEAKKQNPSAPDMSDEAIDSMFAKLEMPLTLNEDKTFKMTMVMFPAEGKWSLKDGKVTLVTEKMMGMDMKALAEQTGQPADKNNMVLTISADGKTMSGVSEQGGGTMTFTKKESK